MTLYLRGSPLRRRLMAIGAAVLFIASAFFAFGGAWNGAFGVIAAGMAMLAASFAADCATPGAIPVLGASAAQWPN